ncbi:MAG TPA: MbnP family protein, partial [Saprospiraceae bacterium]|nr:MbnP family protein [Saprospiraceae bacterium]
MKNIFTLLLFIVATICLHAQNEVILRLDHQLDGKAFALNQEAVSPSGSKYKLTRLQFYISGIRIWHDGNQEMSLPQ